MDFYLDKLDLKHAWLIIAWGHTPRDNVRGWRVDGFKSNDLRARTLAVFPVIPEATSEILGVLRVNLEEINHVSVSEVRQVGMQNADELPTDIELVTVAPETRNDPNEEWNVWEITLGTSLKLNRSKVIGRPNPTEPDFAFVRMIEGNRIFPGARSDCVETVPWIEVRCERLGQPEYAELKVGAFSLTLSGYPDDFNSPITISTEHLLAGCDVTRMIESEVVKTSIKKCFGDHVQLDNNNAEEGIEVKLVRVLENPETGEEDLLGVGFLDRVALKADKDCTFEYWMGDRQLFTAGNGLMVLAHVADGEFVQDTGYVRTTLLEEIEAQFDNREKPLFQMIKSPDFQLPRSGNEKYSVPLQFACYDLCYALSKMPINTRGLAPSTMSMFAERPEVYFAITAPHFRDIAEFEYGALDERERVRTAILALCKLALKEAVDRGSRDTVIDSGDVDIWCSDIGEDAAWNLYELVLSGAALEMMRLGVAFDTKRPEKFAGYYASRCARLRVLDQGKEQPTPIRKSSLGSKFVPVSEAIETLQYLDRDWSKIEKTATYVAQQSGLFLTYPSFEKRDRSGLAQDEFDDKPVRSTMREQIIVAIQDNVADALEKFDTQKDLSLDLVTQVVASWFISDHEKDLRSAAKIIEVSELNQPRGIDPAAELMNAYYAARNSGHAAPDVDLSSIDQAHLDQSLRNSVTVLGKDVIAILMKTSNEKFAESDDRIKVGTE